MYFEAGMCMYQGSDFIEHDVLLAAPLHIMCLLFPFPLEIKIQSGWRTRQQSLNMSFAYGCIAFVRGHK